MSGSENTRPKNSLRDFLARENDYRVQPGYSRQPEFINIRPKIIALTEHYSRNVGRRLLPFAAVNFGDLYLSKRGLPVLRDIGYQKTLQVFTLACVALAIKSSNVDVDFANFVGLHLVGNEEVELVSVNNDNIRTNIFRGVKRTIKECLRGSFTLRNEKIRPMVAFEPVPHLVNFAITDGEQPLPVGAIHYIIAGIHKDIRFTEFKLSTVAASAILATSHSLCPILHSRIEEKLLRSNLVDKIEVKQCFDELKDHVVISHILGPQRASGATPAQGKGKQPMDNVDWRAQQQQWNLVDMDLTWFEP